MNVKGFTILASVAMLAVAGCADEYPESVDIVNDVEENEAPLVGEAEERPVGTFELGTEGAVDVDSGVPDLRGGNSP